MLWLLVMYPKDLSTHPQVEQIQLNNHIDHLRVSHQHLQDQRNHMARGLILKINIKVNIKGLEYIHHKLAMAHLARGMAHPILHNHRVIPPTLLMAHL